MAEKGLSRNENTARRMIDYYERVEVKLIKKGTAFMQCGENCERLSHCESEVFKILNEHLSR